MDVSTTRLRALDVFRGITIAGMILVNQAGVADHVYAQLDHAAWNGCTFTDLVFPFFLFAMGLAMAFSLKPSCLRILKRAAILFALGLVVNGFYQYDFSSIRVMGVLQRIALIYLLAALVILRVSAKAQPALAMAILAGYWLAMTFVPVPGYGVGVLTREGNLGAYLDRMILSAAHLYPGDSYKNMGDPEGIFSTLPAVVSALMGYFCGRRVICKSGVEAPNSRISRELALAGFVCLVLGQVWGLSFPINKKLWTSSYVLFTGGLGLWIFAACYELIEVRRVSRWGFPFEVMGVNSIFAFVASVMLIKIMVKTHVGALTTFEWINSRFFQSWAGPLNGPTIFAVSTAAFWWVVLYGMHRKGWLVKV